MRFDRHQARPGLDSHQWMGAAPMIILVEKQAQTTVSQGKKKDNKKSALNKEAKKKIHNILGIEIMEMISFLNSQRRFSPSAWAIEYGWMMVVHQRCLLHYRNMIVMSRQVSWWNGYRKQRRIYLFTVIVFCCNNIGDQMLTVRQRSDAISTLVVGVAGELENTRHCGGLYEYRGKDGSSDIWKFTWCVARASRHQSYFGGQKPMTSVMLKPSNHARDAMFP